LKIKKLNILNPTEFIVVCYILITACYIVVFFNKIDHALLRLTFRFVYFVVMMLVAWYAGKYENKTVDLIRYIFPVSLIMFWYPETSYLNDCFFPVFDKYFAAADSCLFGCQPSMEFSRVAPWRFFSEIMAFGYFSFYLTITFTFFYFYYKFDKKIYEKVSFIFLFSFFVFYVIFIILPVEGPQFYFAYDKVPAGFLFYKLLTIAQYYGERGTGAFPSSHIGISLIIIFIFYKYSRKILYVLLPLFVILALSTVYIKAHYVVDVVGGFIIAPILFWLSFKVYKKLEHRVK